MYRSFSLAFSKGFSLPLADAAVMSESTSRGAASTQYPNKISSQCTAQASGHFPFTAPPPASRGQAAASSGENSASRVDMLGSSAWSVHATVPAPSTRLE